MAKAGRGSDQFILRMPDGLRDRIKLAADRSGRSMNAEVVEVLEQAFPAQAPELFSLSDVLRLAEAFERAAGPDVDPIATSEMLKVVYRIDTGDDADIDPVIAQAIRRTLSEIRG